MYKQIFTTIIFIALAMATFGTQPVSAQSAESAEKIRAKVNKYGAGKKVTVLLKFDKKEIGEIRDINADDFTIADSSTGEIKSFSYSEVVSVKKKSYAKWIAIGAVVAGAVVAVVVLTLPCRNEGNCF